MWKFVKNYRCCAAAAARFMRFARHQREAEVDLAMGWLLALMTERSRVAASKPMR
jgi:hypothetical protein